MAIVTPMCDSFSPLSVPGCAFLFETEKQFSLVDGKISQLNDLSGNGRHISQGTSANRPLYGSVNIGGYPAISQEAVTARSLYNGSLSGLNGSGAASLYTVCQFGTFDGETHVILCSNYSMSFGSFSAAGQSKLFMPMDASHWLIWDYDSTDPFILVAVYDGSLAEANRMKVWINGASISGSYNNPALTTLGDITTCRILPNIIGAEIATTAIGLHTISFSDSQRQRIERHYSQKYGIALAA